MCPDCDVKKIPKSGPAPVLLRPHELAMVAADWEQYTAWIESNDDAKKVLGELTVPGAAQPAVACKAVKVSLTPAGGCILHFVFWLCLQ